MIITSIATTRIFNKLSSFKAKLDARTRFLLNQCEIVLTPSTLEIYPSSNLIESQVCKKAESIAKKSKKYLNVRIVVRSDNGDFFVS